MTEKRFTVENDFFIREKTTQIVMEVPFKEDCKSICALLNELHEENEQLKQENKFLRCTIESNSQDDYIDYLEKQNERLKERITELASNDKIVFMNGQY